MDATESSMREVTADEMQAVDGGNGLPMDRLSKLMSTLSNILKKVSDTANGVTQNLK